jgi:hypothetical protein
LGASVSAIPFTLYQEIRNDTARVEIEDIDVTIKLTNRDTITPLGIVRDVEVLCGKIKYPTDFLVLGSPQDDFCPIIFGRPFLNTVNAKIDSLNKLSVLTLVVHLMSLISLSFIDNLMIKNCLVKMKSLVLLLLPYLLLIC